MSVTMCQNFDELVPHAVVDALEEATGEAFAGFTYPLNSYINRVYEVMRGDRTRLVAKFYRPGRWSRETIEEEHRFVRELEEEEVPVVAPMQFANGSTLGVTPGGIHFTLYPKRRGREWEGRDDATWQRLGSVLGRLHMVGARQEAPHRIRLHPAESTRADLAHLRNGEFVAPKHRAEFADLADRILKVITAEFERVDPSFIRVHGDCHQGNILDREDVGLLLIDFDDMVMAPAVQDLWMLLPDSPEKCRRELHLVLDGYEVFHEFDDRELRLVEPLRMMRLLYFLAWVSRQSTDPGFERSFPNWGSDAFWRREIGDLRRQLERIQNHPPTTGNLW